MCLLSSSVLCLLVISVSVFTVCSSFLFSCCDVCVVNIYNNIKLLNSMFRFVPGLHGHNLKQTMGLWRVLKHDIEILQSNRASWEEGPDHVGIVFYLFYLSIWVNMGKYLFLTIDYTLTYTKTLKVLCGLFLPSSLSLHPSISPTYTLPGI